MDMDIKPSVSLWGTARRCLEAAVVQEQTAKVFLALLVFLVAALHRSTPSRAAPQPTDEHRDQCHDMGGNLILHTHVATPKTPLFFVALIPRSRIAATPRCGR